jgi:hypothetical protein
MQNMTPLENPRHEAFAQARFSGLSVMDAYHAAGYVGETPQIASKVSQHPDVKARLMELHNAAAKVMVYERNDAIQDLLTIIKARPSEATSDHPLCEVRTGRNGTYHRFPSKLRAMARLVKIMGWDEPAKVEAEEPEPTDRLTQILLKARQGDQESHNSGEDHEDELDTPAKTAPDSDQGGPHSPLCGSGNPPNAPLTPRQEAFARARFSGMGVMEAYQAAGYLGNSPDRASRVSQHPPVVARLAQLRKEAEDMLPYKKHEAINDLIAMVHATPDEANAEHPLCEMRMGNEGPYYRFPCKLHALMLLVRVLGWHRPQKTPFQYHIPKLDNLDHLMLWVQARADKEERERVRKATAEQQPASPRRQ